MSDWKKVEMSDSWNAEEEKEIVGVLVDKQENVGPNESRLYTIETKDGERVGVWGSSVLDSRMKQIYVGEEVKIEFKGWEKNPQTGREYKLYEVYHKESELVKAAEEALEEK